MSADGWFEQPEFVRFAGRLLRGTAIELGEHVAGVHLDGARAEEEVAAALSRVDDQLSWPPRPPGWFVAM
jgi:hypothetical protein